MKLYMQVPLFHAGDGVASNAIPRHAKGTDNRYHISMPETHDIIFITMSPIHSHPAPKICISSISKSDRCWTFGYL